MAVEFADDSRPCTAAGLGEQLIDGEAVLVNAEGGEILVLNEMGATIWQMLDGETELAAIVARVHAEFDVDEARARVDVCGFLAALAERGALAPS